MTVSKLGRWGAVCGLLLAGIFLGGCQSGPAHGDFTQPPPGVGGTSAGNPAPSASSPSGAAASTSDNIDLIRVGDTLVISYSDLPIVAYPDEQRVKDDGTINLMQNQMFKAADKTRGELEKEIRDRYVPQYFKNMTVSVSQKKETQFYFVDGEVRLPARQVYISRTTVLKAIASAGGFTDFAKKTRVKLV
ncbi:MAG TPA: polysaccharide biosynthesis/export family protein, partial [Verrucomicrobiae bacterium]|nr:polysaccharide biosynthesis/export family protein [Verrucomicrobiae bacterium]